MFDLYLVFVCLFSCTALFVSISQVIGCEDRLQNDLYCVGWGVKFYSLTHSPMLYLHLYLISDCCVMFVMLLAVCNEVLRETGTSDWCVVSSFKADWVFAMKYAERLFSESRWSRSTYACLKASFLLMTGDDSTLDHITFLMQ